MKCWPLSPIKWESAERPKPPKRIKPKRNLGWELIYQQAFDNVKAAITNEVVLAYLDFTKPFEIYTDASMMQLG